MATKKKVSTAAKAKSAKKAAPKKASGAKPKKPKAAKGPGVIATMIDLLKAASKTKPLSKAELVKKLAAKFPDRDAESMALTVNAQIHGRCVKEGRCKAVHHNEEGYWAV